MFATAILFTALCLVWISASSVERSHSITINRMEPDINKEWIAENMTMEIKRVNKHEKLLNVLVTILQDVSEDVECEVKVFQQMGGKYMKAPAALPKAPCCKLIENNSNIWKCIIKFSNLPEKCPIPKGSYEVKGINPNECDDAFQLPPNIPENYKTEFQSFKGPTRIMKLVSYSTLKKRF